MKTADFLSPDKPWFVFDRRLFRSEVLCDDYAEADDGRYEVCKYEAANLISSETTAGFHKPVIDLDFGAHLEPSSTKGHYHLYLDREMTHWQYFRLLEALHEAGIVEEGFYRLSLERGASFVRKPGVRKETRS